MTAHFSLVPGALEQRRPHMATWKPTTNTTLYPHMVPMSWVTPLAISNYGKTWSVDAGNLATTLTALAALAVGRRYLRFQSIGWVLTNADDRCDGSGSISVSPTYNGDGSTLGSGGKWFRGGNGGDGLNSGYSNFFLDNAITVSKAWATSVGASILGAGLTVDHLAFDTEVNVDEFGNLSSAWKTALQADSRWATMKAALDALIAADPSTANTTFDVSQWTVGGSPETKAWWSYSKGRQALVNAAIRDGFRVSFPNCTSSDDGYHGRTASVVNALGIGEGGSDLNGGLKYQESIPDDYVSEECYGECSQAGSHEFHRRTYAVISPTGANNPFHVCVWEISRLMGSLKSGRYLKPWVPFVGDDITHMMLGGFGTAAATDKCPYWEAHLAAASLMSAVPTLGSTSWTTPFPEAYYSDSYDGSKTFTGLNQAGKLFIKTGDQTGALRPGIVQSFKLIGSAGNDGTYTVDYANGGIWFDGTSTNIRVNEAIPDATPGGKTECTANDTTTDGPAEVVLADLDSHIGTVGPRRVLLRDIFPGQTDVSDVETLPNGSPITWVGLRHGNQITFCIVIGRTPTNKSLWSSQAITGYVNGVSIGTVATISATKAYVYYTRTYSASETLAFKWTQAAQTNILPSIDPTDGSWAGAAGTVALSSTHLDPINGVSQVYKFTNAVRTLTFNVTAGKYYTAAFYGWAGGLVRARLLQGSDDSLISNMGDQSQSLAGWKAYYFNFVAPHGETTCKLEIGNVGDINYWARFQAVQGLIPGPLS